MSLSSLIVQREVASMRQVEEALARQVIYGGDLVTNLLEVAPVDEAVLGSLLAESMQLAPAPPGPLPHPSDAARALVPVEMAIERSIVPIEASADVLLLAVADPLPAELRDQLAFSLGMQIEERAAPAVRVWQAIASGYGAPLDRRMQRLVARLAGEPTPSGAPLTPLLPGPASTPPSARPRSAPPPPRVSSRPPPRAAPVAGTAPITGAASMRAAPGRRTTLTNFPARRLSSPPTAPISATPEFVPSVARPATESRAPLQRALAPATRAGRRRRGPLTFAAARHEAEEAIDRDGLLALFFDFSRQFFEYAALFLVQADIAEGWDGFGSGAPRERVLGIGVPLDLPSFLSRARDSRAPVVGCAAADGLDAAFLNDLQRPRTAEIVVVPLVVRTRAVALLVGDCGDAGVDRGALEQVTAFCGVASKAFERIIVRRKLEGFVAASRADPSGRLPDPLPADFAPPPSPLAPASSVLVAASPPALLDPVVSDEVPSPYAPAVAPSLSPPSHLDASPGPDLTPDGLSLALTEPEPSEDEPAQAAAQVPRSPSVIPSSPSPSGRRPWAGSAPPPSHDVARSVTAGIIAARRISNPPIPREEPPSSPDLAAARAEPVIEPRVGRMERAPELPPREPNGTTASPFDEAWLESRHAAAPTSASAICVPPHRPPSARTSANDELPSIIVDVESELEVVVDRLLAGEIDDQAEGELLRQGGHAMRVLMARFPGPLTVDRARIATLATPPRASECGPLLRLIARERKVALPFVLERMADPDPEVRGWATHLLCELPYLEGLPPLIAALRDPDEATRTSAALAIGAMARGFGEEVLAALGDLARAPDPSDRAAALRAVGEVREPTLVPELIGSLSDPDLAVVLAARAALVRTTRQDFATDARLWDAWWVGNGRRHRVEWLIDALSHEIPEVRKAAGEELRVLSRQYFGYASDLPVRDRERAQQRYRDWWITEGRSARRWA